MSFASFGRSVGWRVLLARDRTGLDLLLTPVSIVRYWEFPFLLGNLRQPPGKCLDVASPRLVTYYVARYSQPDSIRVLNPDESDAILTASLAKRIGLRSIEVEAQPASVLLGDTAKYDSIWSISVLEHISGNGDTDAIRAMYEALAPGGRIVVTVPVDRRPWDEYRKEDVYGLGLTRTDRGFFFQRWYDETTLAERLIHPVSASAVRTEWFGERVKGRFAEYEKDWIRRGHGRTVDDPREIADWYRPFASWADMPGQGVCGIVIERPA